MFNIQVFLDELDLLEEYISWSVEYERPILNSQKSFTYKPVSFSFSDYKEAIRKREVGAIIKTFTHSFLLVREGHVKNMVYYWHFTKYKSSL